MEKRLVAVGNSVGFVIDRALCHVLHLKKGTEVSITTDGRRLLIEPLAERPAPLQTLDAKRLMRELIEQRGGPPQELHERLHPGIGPRAVTKALGWAVSLKTPLSDADARQLERYRVVLERVRSGDRWKEAIDAALASCG